MLLETILDERILEFLNTDRRQKIAPTARREEKIICRKEGVFKVSPQFLLLLTQIFTSLAEDQGFATRKMSSEHVATFGKKLIGHSFCTCEKLEKYPTNSTTAKDV